MKTSLPSIVNTISAKVNICRMSIETVSKLETLDRAIQDKARGVFDGMITENEAVQIILHHH